MNLSMYVDKAHVEIILPIGLFTVTSEPHSGLDQLAEFLMEIRKKGYSVNTYSYLDEQCGISMQPVFDAVPQLLYMHGYDNMKEKYLKELDKLSEYITVILDSDAYYPGMKIPYLCRLRFIENKVYRITDYH